MGVKTQIRSKGGHKTVVLNRRRAIRERCLNCSAWSCSEIKMCPHENCGLHPFRSGQGKQDAKARAKAIRSYCSWCMATEQPSRCVVVVCPLYCYRKTTVELPKLPIYARVQGRVAVNEQWGGGAK